MYGSSFTWVDGESGAGMRASISYRQDRPTSRWKEVWIFEDWGVKRPLKN